MRAQGVSTGEAMNLCSTYAGTSSAHLRLSQEHRVKQNKAGREFSKGTRDRKEVNELMNVIVMDCVRSVGEEW